MQNHFWLFLIYLGVYKFVWLGHTDDAQQNSYSSKLRRYTLSSVTRLGNFLLFGPGGNNYFTQIACIIRQFL